MWRKTYLYVLALPLLLFFLGAASNQIVLIANHDTFPVNINEVKVDEMSHPKNPFNVLNLKPTHTTFQKDSEEPSGPIVLSDGTVMLDDTHCVMSKKTHLNFLADEFDLGSIYSVGDFMLMLGSWVWGFAPIVWGVLAFRKLNRKTRQPIRLFDKMYEEVDGV